MAKTQNLWAFWSNAMPSRCLTVHGGALISNVLFESWRIRHLARPVPAHVNR